MDLKPWTKVQDIIPQLSHAEYAQLKSSIEQEGVKIPLLVMADGRIIDGHHRWFIANELEIDAPYHVEDCTEQKALTLALILNIARRQLSLEQLKPIHNYLRQNREERKEVAQALREQGQTQEQVAAAVGVAQSTLAGWENEPETNTTNIKTDNSFNFRDRRLSIPKSEHQAIYDLYQQGQTQAQIAAEYKVTQQAIGKIIAKVQKRIDKEQELEDLKARTQQAQTEVCRLICGDFSKPDFDKWLLPEHSIDAIITDPPYPKKYLSLYGILAQHASYLLRPDGLLLAMCGQSYLPDIFSLMTPHLTYRWTLAYLTPGGQSPQIWPRRINAFWKPVLVFSNETLDGDDWHGDVIKSDVNDNDKRFHKWGQSESGIARLVESFTQENDIILDPFCGGGTTGVVSLALNRRFIGIDIDPEQIAVTTGRINEQTS